MTENLDKLTAFAEGLANSAREITLKYFRTNIDSNTKEDSSPVTIADRETEILLRDRISKTFPTHGILGEEFGPIRIESEYVWVLDPIDGTKSFISGKPLFGTLIGLLQRGKAVVGVCDMPALRERWVGKRGETTKFNGAPARVRKCPELRNSWLYATSPQMFTRDHFHQFEALRKASQYAVYGAECQAYGLLACGWVDIVCEDTLGPYDYVALDPIVSGAGGVMSDWAGRPLGLESNGTVLALGDPSLKNQVLEILKP